MTEERQPVLAHLEELRNRVLKAAVAVVVGAAVAFIFRGWIFDVLTRPYDKVIDDRNLVFFRPTEAFSLFMRISLFGGFLIASPVVLYQLWAFVSPGLHRREKRFILPITFVLALLFLTGVAMGYWALERGLDFLLDFGEGQLDATIGGDFYLSFALRFILVFGVAFEFPVFLFTAAAVGIVDHRSLARGRRWAAVIIVVVGAVVTPSGDPLTLLLLSVPLYIFYEATIWIVRFTIGRRRR